MAASIRGDLRGAGATGAMGRTILRRLLGRPELEVVGVLVHDPAKVGRDVGAIAGGPVIGVVATASPADVLALDADVFVHAPRIQPQPARHDDDIVECSGPGRAC